MMLMALRYLAADETDCVAILAGWSKMPFFSLAARLHDLSCNGAISLAMWLGGFGLYFRFAVMMDGRWW